MLVPQESITRLRVQGLGSRFRVRGSGFRV